MGQRKLLIIGSGLTGLNIARNLSHLPLSITLCEKEKYCGGSIHTTKEILPGKNHSLLFEYGANSIRKSSPEIIKLCMDLGIWDKAVPINPNYPSNVINIYSQDQGKFLSTKTTPLALEFALRLCFIKPSKVNDKLSIHDAISLFGPRFLKKVTPFIQGIFGAQPKELNFKACLPSIYNLLKGNPSILKFLKQKNFEQQKWANYFHENESYETFPGSSFSFSGGLSTLTSSLEKSLSKVKIYKDHCADRIQLRDDKKFAVKFLDGAKKKIDEEFDFVVSTVPPKVLRNILIAPSSPSTKNYQEKIQKVCASLNKFENIPLQVTHMAYEMVEFPNNLYEMNGFLMDHPSNLSSDHKNSVEMMGVRFDSSNFKDIDGAIESKRYMKITAMLRRANKKVENGNTGEEKVEKFMEEKFGWKKSSVVFKKSKVVDYPLYGAGHLGAMEELEDGLAEVKNLFVTGWSFDGISIPSRFNSAAKVASKVEKVFEGDGGSGKSEK